MVTTRVGRPIMGVWSKRVDSYHSRVGESWIVCDDSAWGEE